MRELIAAQAAMPAQKRRNGRATLAPIQLQRIRRVLAMLAQKHTPFDQILPALAVSGLDLGQPSNLTKYYTEERSKQGLTWQPFRQWKILQMYEMWRSGANFDQVYEAMERIEGRELPYYARTRAYATIKRFNSYGGFKLR